ncbi:MAG: atpC [Rhodospirillales bacterium]|jgi:F-type H+-transporting ATPase subunit epsilon|nr:atpC [Rhodospirillales bacterium]
MAEAGSQKIQFDLVTPTALAISEPVDMVVVPGAEGDIGVLPGHTPLITTLRPGLVDVHNGGRITQSLFVTGGFAEATAERCTVLAETVEAITDISAQDAQARLAAAREALTAAQGSDIAAAQAKVNAAEALVQALAVRRAA